MRIGVDFTNTAIRAGVVSGGHVLRSSLVEMQQPGDPAHVLDLIARTVTLLSASPDGVGIAIPGEVNADGRCWRLPNTRGFEGVHIAEEAARRLHCPISVENRATAAALAEQRYGHGRSYQTFLLVVLDTGIGGGLVIGRQLYPGSNGFGAEIGHLRVDTSLDAEPCACGQRGCLEAYAGAPAVLRRYAAVGGQATELDAVAASARRGEWSALLAFESMGLALGRALAAVQNFMDVGAVVFAGAASSYFDLFEPFVRKELREHAFAPPLAEVPLLVSALGDNAGVIGAAYLTDL